MRAEAGSADATGGQQTAGARLIDGVALARSIRDQVARDTAELSARGVTPGLTVVLVGDDPASAVYVRAKGKACDEAGMRGDTITRTSRPAWIANTRSTPR